MSRLINLETMATRKSATKPSKVDVYSLDMDGQAIREKEARLAQESDESILTRLRERFEILDDMTRAVKKGDVRAMIVLSLIHI